jgi:hypothetical protein
MRAPHPTPFDVLPPPPSQPAHCPQASLSKCDNQAPSNPVLQLVGSQITSSPHFTSPHNHCSRGMIAQL